MSLPVYRWPTLDVPNLVVARRYSRDSKIARIELRDDPFNLQAREKTCPIASWSEAPPLAAFWRAGGGSDCVGQSGRYSPKRYRDIDDRYHVELQRSAA